MMPVCESCGAVLRENARICDACGAQRRPTSDSSVSRVSTYVVDGEISAEGLHFTEEERQNILDTMRKKFIGEKLTWRIVSILCIVAYVSCIFLSVTSFISMILTDVSEDPYYYEDSDDYYDGPYTQTSTVDEYEYVYEEEPFGEFEIYTMIFMISWMGVSYGVYIFFPPAIIGFIMSAKVGKVSKKLYVDCSLAYRRCTSWTSIILGFIFNPLTLIFTISLFVLARNNRELIMETAAIQREYYK